MDLGRFAVREYAILASAAALIASAPVGAQQQVRVAVTGGVATDQRGIQSRAASLAPGVVLTSARGTLLTFDGNITRFEREGLSIGAGAGLAERDHLAGPFTLTLDGSVNTSRLNVAGTSATFLVGDIAPALELSFGEFAVFGGGRAAYGHVSQNEQKRIIPPFGGGGSTTSVSTRTGVGPMIGGSYTSSPRSGELFRVSVREERLTVENVQVTDVTVAAMISGPVATFSGNVGNRTASDERGSFGAATLSISVNPSVYFNASAGRYPTSRLTGAVAGNYVSAGFTFGTSPTPRRSTGPLARGAPRNETGYTRFSIEAPDAAKVEIAGDFNDWTPIPAQRAANGVWYADLRLKPGQYRYSFRVNGREWRVPPGATAVNDGFGGKSAWITVS